MGKVVAKIGQPDKATEPEMQTVQMLITPSIAQQWLAAMPHQRRLRATKVEQIKLAIQGGRWKVLPHGIVLDNQGLVIDGQHRLTAIVAADIPVQARVTFGAPPDLFNYIDSTQSEKSMEDALRHIGVSFSMAKHLPAGLMMLYSVLHGYSPMVNARNIGMTNEDAVVLLRAYPEIERAGELTIRARLAPSRSTLTYWAYLGLKKDGAATEQFIEQLVFGSNLNIGDPALLLRNTWIRDRTARVWRERTDQCIMFARALKCHLTGKRLHSWRSTDFGRGKLPSFDDLPVRAG